MKFSIMNATGHTEEHFSKDDAAAMAKAEALFNELTQEQGYRIAEKTGDGTHKMPAAGDQKFNPDAEDVIFTRNIQGG
jgi:hypothetical protein